MTDAQSSAVEAMALAICRKLHGDYFNPFMDAEAFEFGEEIARAALAAISTPAPSDQAPDAWIVEVISGPTYGKRRRVIDAKQYDVESDAFWIEGAREKHKVTRLYAHPAPSDQAGLVGLLTKAVGDITAALILAGKADKIAKWTAPYVAAINDADAKATAPTITAGEGGGDA